MRICLVYDCLFPWTVGGAERWYRNLGERLAADGHDVTYLTLRQWPRSEPPAIPGVRVIAVGPQLDLYAEGGRRKIAPPLVFGLGVLAHLLRRGRGYDVVHTASFPYFSLLAAALARPLHRFGLVVDWHEFWTREYWEDYLGRAAGRVGWSVQALCARVPQRAFCFAQLHARRLREGGLRGAVGVLRGEYAGLHAGDEQVREPELAAEPPRAVFAGRHIPEKRVPALVPALAHARAELPELALDVYGDGPDRALVEATAASAGLDGALRVHGFVAPEAIDDALAHASCMVLPSVREGYGLIVVEALARGCPAVVVAHPDNAATELIDDGVNGVIAPSEAPADLGAAIVRAVRGGEALRRSTARWYAEHARELALSTSLDAVAASYGPDARR